MWTILVTGGLRIGEALAIRWSEVNLAKQTIEIARALVEVGGYVHETDTKTDESERRLEIGPLAVAALRRRHKEARREGHDAPSDLVFPTTDGKPMRRSNLRHRHFVPIGERVGLKGLQIHDTRRTMTSFAVAAGAHPKVIADRLGHSTTRLTMDRYASALPGLGRETADKIDGLLTAAKRRKRNGATGKIG